MKTYTKTHGNKKAADIHLAKIKKRGGIATTKQVAGDIQIDYHFPEKAPAKSKKAPAKKAKRYDVISPDGFTIRIGDQGLFKSIEEAKTYFHKWKKRYQQQGYYSSNYGRIELADLMDECELKEIN